MQFPTWFVRKIFFYIPVGFRHRVRDLLPDDWVYRFQQFVNGREWERFVDATSKAKALEAKLWGGFSEKAKEDLLTLRGNVEQGISERTRAAWALARWHWVERDYEAVLADLNYIRAALPEYQLRQSFRLLEIDCLMMLGKVPMAREYAEAALKMKPDNVHYKLAFANTYSPSPTGDWQEADDAERLRIINAILHDAGLTPIKKVDASKELTLDNIAGSSLPYKESEAPELTVSVIMPVFNSAVTLSIALRSLLEQSWQHLQIIVVDDCSTDNTYEVAKSFAEQDDRVIVLQQERNQGAYAARNLGLLNATGEFVTTHDADDWSHPQKIEIQIRDFLEHPQHKANLTYWVRTLPSMYFKGTSRPSERLVQMNHSSLMLRRELLLKLGGWDRVRITGDTELIWRLEHHPDGGKLVHLFPEVPLSFALEDISSLTRNSRTHVRTMFYGVRREYREAIAHWHKRSDNHTLPLVSSKLQLDTDTIRPFPAPGFIHAIRKSLILDRLMFMDFNAPGPAFHNSMNILDRWESAGMKIGIFHWRYYPWDVREPLNEELRDRALAGRLNIIAPGERVVTEKAIIAAPPIASYLIDLAPEVVSETIEILDDEIFCCLQDEGAVSWEVDKVKANVIKIFNRPVKFASAPGVE
ncbi:glycosyltransferase family 2 protein [Halomonas desiderata]|uniref:glycosyltransferase n=1 Tax=Billgrantia desiderata TaxID=52021 RepID=UPI00174B3299|nr:glycosyltransferase family 2 protein [Halomonas desiderata]